MLDNNNNSLQEIVKWEVGKVQIGIKFLLELKVVLKLIADHILKIITNQKHQILQKNLLLPLLIININYLYLITNKIK